MIQSTKTTQSKAEAFRKIAEKRTTRVLDSLRLLGQCANRRSYEYTDDQVKKIFTEIRRAVRDAEQRFKDDRKNIKFKL